MSKFRLLLCLTLCALPFFISCARQRPVQRFGSVIGIKPEMIQEYKDLHANAWPEITKMIKDCNLQNYSIYLKQFDDGNYYLFAYFEYTGKDIEADMAKMKADPMTKKWWTRTDPCQIPFKEAKAKDEMWAPMEEVFHLQ